MYPTHVKALRVGRILSAAVLTAGLAGGARPAAAGDVIAFIALPRPDQNWDRGYGAALTSTWFNVVSFEGEAARFRGNTTDEGMTTFTASALLSPPVGALTPYGGLGYGLFRQNVGDDSDIGRLRALILGAKLKLGGLIVVKGEYRRLELSGTPLREMDSRLSAGAGIAF
jgi:hypothetical protein